jgi:hypothetical protein
VVALSSAASILISGRLSHLEAGAREEIASGLGGKMRIRRRGAKAMTRSTARFPRHEGRHTATANCHVFRL